MSERQTTLRRLPQRLRPSLGTLSLAVVASVVSAAAAAVWAWLLGPLLDSVLTGRAVQLGPISLQRQDLAVQVPLLVVAVAAVKALAGWLHAGLMQGVAQSVMGRFRRDVYGRLLAVPAEWLEARHSGELLSRFTSDVAQLEFSVSQAMSSWVKDSLQVVALLAVCATTDLRLFALTFLVLPAMVWPVSRFAKALKKTARGTQGSLAALTALTAEQLINLPAVQAWSAQGLALRRFDDEQVLYLEQMKRSLFVRGIFTPVLELLGIVGLAVCIAFGARAIATEPLLAARLLSFLAAALLMYQPLKALSGTFSQVAQGLASAERLFEVLDAPAEDHSGATAAPLGQALSFEGVRVVFADGREGLSELSLTVPAGKTVALVGASGAGKTTVLSLVMGFVKPTSGQVQWDGANLASLSSHSVRRQVAWVQQEPVLLSGSVRDNLKVGRADATEEAMWTALRRANAEDFVRALPSGLEEEVGERGARFSGGQRQRLAIARAFLVEPSLLLLDEPTSALDAHAEAEVQLGLLELMKGRTTLLVTHRPSTLKGADLVYELKGGRASRML